MKIKKNKPMLIDIKQIIDSNKEVALQLPSINTELVIKCKVLSNEPIVEVFNPEIIDITDVVENQEGLVPNPSEEPTSIANSNIAQIDLNEIEKNVYSQSPSVYNNKMKPKSNTSNLTKIKTKTNQPIQSFLKLKDKGKDISKELKKSANGINLNNSHTKTTNIYALTPSLLQDEAKLTISPMRSPLQLNSIKHSFTGKTKALTNIPSPIVANKSKHFYLNTGAETEVVLKTIPNQFNRSYEILEDYFVQDNTLSEFSPNEGLFQLDPFQIESFCTTIFISGVSKIAEIIPNSSSYPAMCGHKECEIFSSFQPSVLSNYQNEKKYKLEINDLAHLCFPVGIKLCYMTDEEQYPLPQKSFMNVIKNEKGMFYVMTVFYYKTISVSRYDKEYLQNPLKEYAKFQDVVESNSSFNEQEFNDKLQIVSMFIEKDEIYIPESISLISRYPYFNQMEICLNNIIQMPLRRKEELINHIINEIVVPDKGKRVMFFIPNETQMIELNSPYNQNRVALSKGKSHLLFDFFSTDNIVTVFHLMLLEQKIIFIHNDYQTLSDISFAFISLVYPFSWVHPYIPVASLSSILMLHSIVPIVMGTDEFLLKHCQINQLFEENLSGIFVFLAKNTLSLTVNMKKKSRNAILKELKLPELPSKVYDFLVNNLRELKKNYKNKKTTIDKVNDKIKEILCQGMVMLIGDYKKHMFMTHDDMPLFNSEGFLSMKEKKEKYYYQEALVTQMFSQFLLNEQMLLSKKKKRRSSNAGLNDSNCNLNRTNSYDNNNDIIDTTYFDKMLFKYHDQSLSRNPHRSFSMKKNLSKLKRNNSSDSKLNISNSNISSNINLETTTSRKDSTPTLTRKDSLTSLDIMKNVNNNYLIPPYFIKDSTINTDKYKIEEFIKATIQTSDKPELNKQIIKKYNDSDFLIDNIKDSNKRYFIQRANNNNNNMKTIINHCYTNNRTSNIKNKLLDALNPANLFVKSKNDLNTITNEYSNTHINRAKELEEQKLNMAEWFINICTPERKNRTFKIIDITDQIKTIQGREEFANLIMQWSVLDDRNNKLLPSSSFDEMLRVLRVSLAYVTKAEYHICKLLTLALFSYYKTDKKNTFLYEEYTKKGHQCKLWSLDDFWVKWYKEDIDEKENEEDNSISSNESPVDNAKYLLLRMEELMKQLKIKGDLIKNVIVNDLGNAYLDPEDFVDFKQNHVLNSNQ